MFVEPHLRDQLPGSLTGGPPPQAAKLAKQPQMVVDRDAVEETDFLGHNPHERLRIIRLLYDITSKYSNAS